MTTRHVLITTAAAFTSIIAMSGFAVPVQAGNPLTVTAPKPDPDLRAHRIRYAEINLMSDAGRRALTSRVKAAVDTVCGNPQGLEPLQEREERLKCSKASWLEAEPQIASAIVRARSGQLASRNTSTDILISAR